MLASLPIPPPSVPMNGGQLMHQSVLHSATLTLLIPRKTELASSRSSSKETKPIRLVSMQMQSMDSRWERIWQTRRKHSRRRVRITRLSGGSMLGSKRINGSCSRRQFIARRAWSIARAASFLAVCEHQLAMMSPHSAWEDMLTDFWPKRLLLYKCTNVTTQHGLALSKYSHAQICDRMKRPVATYA